MFGSRTTTLRYDSPVGAWVAQYPQTADVFDMLRIDYCCDGDKPLENACWENGLEVLRVHSCLRCTIAEIDNAMVDDWLHAPLAELCDHITSTHHALLKSALPTLSDLIAQVVAIHGEMHEELCEVQEHFSTWRNDIIGVMREEEQSLFPTIQQLETDALADDFELCSAENQIRMINFEHKDIGVALKKVRSASRGFAKPTNACATYGQMYGLLRRVEKDVRVHVHKEEHILFPRVIELANRMKRDRSDLVD